MCIFYTLNISEAVMDGLDAHVVMLVHCYLFELC